MTKGGKTVNVSEEQEIQALLGKIDGLDVLKGQSKRAKLEDTKGEITRVEADLLGLRRMLVQHRKPNAVIDQTGTTISRAINDRVVQLNRLRHYLEEIQALPDDESEAEPGNDESEGRES